MAIVADIAMEVTREFLNASNKSTYDEHSLRKSAEDYFIEQLDKKNAEDIELNFATDNHENIRNVAKFRILNDDSCRAVLGELKTLV